MKNIKFTLILILILIIGASLRLYRTPENLYFGENAYEYLEAKKIIETKQIPLVGISTSHSWLLQGPLYYWIFVPVLALANYDPVSIAYVFVILHLFSIPLNYFVVKNIFGRRTAVISSLFMAISPSWLYLAKEARSFALIPLLLYPFLYHFYKFSSGNKRSLLWAAFFYGLILNLHYSPLMFIPGVIFIIYRLKLKISKRNFILSSIFFLIPQLPLIIYSAINNWSMLLKFAVWIPYRITSFLGIYKAADITSGKYITTLSDIYNFFQASLSFSNNFLIPFIILLVLFYLLYKYIKAKNKSYLIVSSLFISGLGALLIHTNPPWHYFVPLFPILAIIVSDFISKISQPIIKLLVIIIFLYFAYQNSLFLFSHKWFYQNNDVYNSESIFPSYKLEKAISSKIIEDAKGHNFNLRRVGKLDHYPDNFILPYRYILWRNGNEPAAQKQDLVYTIYEDTTKLPVKPSGELFWISNVAVLKENL